MYFSRFGSRSGHGFPDKRRSNISQSTVIKDNTILYIDANKYIRPNLSNTRASQGEGHGARVQARRDGQGKTRWPKRGARAKARHGGESGGQEPRQGVRRAARRANGRGSRGRRSGQG